MPRRKLEFQTVYPYHIYNRSNSKDPFPIQGHAAWKLWTQKLIEGQMIFEVQIHAFTLMANHYHLLISTPKNNLADFMHFFSLSISKCLTLKDSKINHRFGSRYKGCLIVDPKDFLMVKNYIYQNPVRAKICLMAFDYEFSTLKFELNQSDHGLKITCAPEIFKNQIKLGDLVRAIPETFSLEDSKLLKAKLSRSKFNAKRRCK